MGSWLLWLAFHTELKTDLMNGLHRARQGKFLCDIVSLFYLSLQEFLRTLVDSMIWFNFLNNFKPSCPLCDIDWPHNQNVHVTHNFASPNWDLGKSQLIEPMEPKMSHIGSISAPFFGAVLPHDSDSHDSIKHLLCLHWLHLLAPWEGWNLLTSSWVGRLQVTWCSATWHSTIMKVDDFRARQPWLRNLFFSFCELHDYVTAIWRTQGFLGIRFFCLLRCSRNEPVSRAAQHSPLSADKQPTNNKQ